MKTPMPDDWLEKYANGTLQDVGRPRARQSREDPVRLAILVSISDSSLAEKIIRDNPYALGILLASDSQLHYGALLALTFLHRNSSPEFRARVLELVQQSREIKLRELAIVTVGNLFRQTSDPNVLALLSTILKDANHREEFVDTVQLAIASVEGALPNDDRLQFIRESQIAVNARAKLIREKVKSLQNFPGDDSIDFQ